MSALDHNHRFELRYVLQPSGNFLVSPGCECGLHLILVADSSGVIMAAPIQPHVEAEAS